MTKYKFFLSILSGLLLSVAFPPFPIFVTAFFAFVPLFFIIEQNPVYDANLYRLDKKRKLGLHKFSYIYITFFIYHLSSNWWISSFQSHTDPYLLFAGLIFDLLHPFFFFVPFAVLFLLVHFFNKCKKNKISISAEISDINNINDNNYINSDANNNDTPYKDNTQENKYSNKTIGTTIFLFPFIWTAFEWLFSLGDLGYPWLSIAHTQYTNIYWYQIIDITGIWGATFLISFVNVLIFWLIKNAEKINNKFTFRGFFNTFNKKIAFIFIYLAIIVPYIYGFTVIKNYNYEDDLDNNQYLNVGLIQPNIDPWNKWQPSTDKQLSTLFRLQDSIVSAYNGLDLCIWPETAIPISAPISNGRLGLAYIEKQILDRKVSLMSGIMRIHFYEEGETKPVMFHYQNGIPYSIFNTAFLLNVHTPKQHLSTSYLNNSTNLFDITYHDKSKLTPFAENFPFVEELAFAKDWLRWGIGFSSWTKGNEQNLLVVGSGKKMAKIAPIICIESIYPSFVRKFALEGANIFAVITNDAWYNYTSGLEQHYIIDATRAIENRRYIARCGNSGVTGFISPIGKSIVRVDEYKAMAIAASIPILNADNLTIYTKYGDYFPVMCCIVLIIVTLWKFIKERYLGKRQIN